MNLLYMPFYPGAGKRFCDYRMAKGISMEEIVFNAIRGKWVESVYSLRFLNPCVDMYISAKQAKDLAKAMKADVERDKKFEFFIPYIEFIEKNAADGGFFIFFGD